MGVPQIHESLPWPRWLKVAVGATVTCFLAAGMFVLPTADRKRIEGRQVFSQMYALESAVINFQTVYGCLPSVGGHVRTDGPDGVKFLNILLGIEEGSSNQNSRKIKFLSVREAKGRKNGLKYSATGNRVEGLYDSWGNPFIVKMNVKKEDKLRFMLGNKLIELPGRSVAVYSAGKDGKPGTADDVKTW
jgi:hypothetical protein